MNKIINHFIDMHNRVNKLSAKEQSNRINKMFSYIFDETIKLENRDKIFDIFITAMSCTLAFDSKLTKEDYLKVKNIATFATLPEFKEYSKIINSYSHNISKILKELFKEVSVSKIRDEKYIRFIVELLVSLKNDVEYFKIVAHLFKK